MSYHHDPDYDDVRTESILIERARKRYYQLTARHYLDPEYDPEELESLEIVMADAGLLY